MFDKVNEWLKKTPSIYVTQKWKTAYLDAINGMALDMREASPFGQIYCGIVILMME